MNKMKKMVLFFTFLWAIYLIYLQVVRSGCSFSEEYATAHVIETAKSLELNIQYLGQPKFHKQSCSYDF